MTDKKRANQKASPKYSRFNNTTPVSASEVQNLINLMHRALAFDVAIPRADLYLIGTRNNFTDAQTRRAVDILAERGTAYFRFNDDGSVTVCLAGEVAK